MKRACRMSALAGLVATLLFSSSVAAQDFVLASFLFARDEVLIGEPVELVLSVRVVPGYTVSFPALEENWGQFSVIDAGEPVVEVLEDAIIHRQSYTVVPWQVGQLSTPEAIAFPRAADVTELLPVRVQSATLLVPSVLDSSGVLRPRKPVLDMPYFPRLLVLAFAGTSSLLAAWALGRFRAQMTRWWRSLRLRAAPKPLSVKRRLTMEMAQVARSAHSPQEKFRSLAPLLRSYLALRFAIPMADMTTDEVVQWLVHQEVLSPARLEELSVLSNWMDVATYAPQSSAESFPSADVVLLWLQAAERDLSGGTD